MKRLLLVLFAITAFSLSAAVSVSAAPMSPSISAQGAGSRMDSKAWIGKTTDDLLVQLGIPSVTVRHPSGGETLEYVRHVPLGRGNTIDLVQLFDVNRDGKVTSGVTRQL